MTRKSSFSGLFELANSQQGYFTSKQAISSGFPDSAHPYHVKAGHWIRENRGIYRLAHYPQTPNPDLVLWSLWSKNRQGKTEGLFSHQTALRIFGLSDIMPTKLHITVPPDFRRSLPAPPLLKIHHCHVPKDQMFAHWGFQSTSPYRTLIDLIQKKSISDDFLKQALDQALAKGLIRQAELKITKGLSYSTQQKLKQLLTELGR